MHALVPFLFLLSALPTWSQWHSRDPAHLFERFQHRTQQSPADSADFALFAEAVAWTTPDIDIPRDLHEYRLGWEVNCEGVTWVQRGDGIALTAFLKDPPESRFGELVCCPSFLGGRYAVVHWEPPTGLVRFRYWFFERK